MPKVAEFFGIIIYMYYREHGKAHFHAQYQNYMATFFIEDGGMEGMLPPRAKAMVEEWRTLHREELLQNWERAKAHHVLLPIQPLE
jgi:hypothetical protein